MRTVVLMSLSLLLGVTSLTSQTSQNTFQEIRIERSQDPGVALTLSPPTTAITPYSIIWPDRPPESGQELIGIGTNPVQLNWMYNATAVMEIVNPSTYNVRRKKIGHQDTNIIGTPGFASYDFMGSRTSTTQTAAGNYSLILGGRNNRTGDTATVVAGGLSNVSEEYWSLIIGGSNNYQSGEGWRSGIMGGYGNQATGYEHTIMGGYQNNITTELWRQSIMGGYSNQTSDTRTTIICGYDNTVTGVDASLLSGWLNSVTGDESMVAGGRGNIVVTSTSNDRPGTVAGGQQNEVRGSYGTILGGFDNVHSGDYGTIPGGRLATLTSSADETFLFNGSNRSITVSTADAFIVTNADLWLANNSAAPRTVRFFESYGNSGTFSTTADWVELVSPQTIFNDVDNVYTLPDQISTTGSSVLAIADTPAPGTSSATLAWKTVPTSSVTSFSAGSSTNTISASSLSFETFVKVTPTNTPSNRTLRLANGTINGAMIFIRIYGSSATRGVRMFDSDANLNLAGTASVDLERYDTITLVWDETSSEWIEVGRSNN